MLDVLPRTNFDKENFIVTVYCTPELFAVFESFLSQKEEKGLMTKSDRDRTDPRAGKSGASGAP